MKLKKVRIYAADLDDELSDDDEMLGDNLSEEEVDPEEDEEVEEIKEDDPAIDKLNNIDNHYIAECDRCKGVFISAVIESDQQVESISGMCPLCGEETEQYLKWVIKPVGGDEQ